jgi:hypothetical protein
MGRRVGEVAMMGAERVRRYLAGLAGRRAAERAATRAAKKRLEEAARLVKAARRDRAEQATAR